MSGVNKVIVLGRLGRDPEISYSKGGMAVCKFSLATSKKKKDGSEVTSWHRCTAFDKTGEAIGKYLSKGRMLYVEGELSYGQYDKDGQTHYTTDIIVNQFSFVDSAGKAQDNNKTVQGSSSYGPGARPMPENSGTDPFMEPGPVGADDDIPF